MYLDSNNLYGHSVIQFLPTEILDWVNPKKNYLESYFNDGSIGCFLEIDFDYPGKFRGLHNDYTLAPEKNQGHKNNFVCVSIRNHRR